MIVESVWKVVRLFVPVQLYPLLSPIYRAIPRSLKGRLPRGAAEAPAIGVHGITFGALIDPRLWSAVGLATVGAIFERSS